MQVRGPVDIPFEMEFATTKSPIGTRVARKARKAKTSITFAPERALSISEPYFSSRSTLRGRGFKSNDHTYLHRKRRTQLNTLSPIPCDVQKINALQQIDIRQFVRILRFMKFRKKFTKLGRGKRETNLIESDKILMTFLHQIQKQNEFVLLKILSERCKNSFSVRLIRSINFFLYLALAKRGTHLTLKISTYAEE